MMELLGRGNPPEALPFTISGKKVLVQRNGEWKPAYSIDGNMYGPARQCKQQNRIMAILDKMHTCIRPIIGENISWP